MRCWVEVDCMFCGKRLAWSTLLTVSPDYLASDYNLKKISLLVEERRTGRLVYVKEGYVCDECLNKFLEEMKKVFREEGEKGGG